MDNRGVSPVVEKVLAAGIVLLFVGGTATALFGGVVPDYQTAAGQEMAERVVSQVADAAEESVPDVTGPVEVTRRVDVPATISRHGYAIAVVNRTLALSHPRPGIGARASLELPPTVGVTEQSVDAGATVYVRVAGGGRNRTLTLTGERP